MEGGRGLRHAAEVCSRESETQQIRQQSDTQRAEGGDTYSSVSKPFMLGAAGGQ
jgi:hypothetical protein